MPEAPVDPTRLYGPTVEPAPPVTHSAVVPLLFVLLWSSGCVAGKAALQYVGPLAMFGMAVAIGGVVLATRK